MNRRTLVIGKPLHRDEGSRDGGGFTPQYLAIQSGRMERNHVAPEPRTESKLANARAQILRLRDLVRDQQARLLVVLIPDENQINLSLAEAVQRPDELDYDLTMPQKLLVPMLEAEGLDVLDLLGDFLTDPRRLYMNDTHWTPEGHQLAAERIAPRVRQLLDSAGDSGAPER